MEFHRAMQFAPFLGDRQGGRKGFSYFLISTFAPSLYGSERHKVALAEFVLRARFAGKVFLPVSSFFLIAPVIKGKLLSRSIGLLILWLRVSFFLVKLFLII